MFPPAVYSFFDDYDDAAGTPVRAIRPQTLTLGAPLIVTVDVVVERVDRRNDRFGLCNLKSEKR